MCNSLIMKIKHLLIDLRAILIPISRNCLFKTLSLFLPSPCDLLVSSGFCAHVRGSP